MVDSSIENPTFSISSFSISVSEGTKMKHLCPVLHFGSVWTHTFYQETKQMMSPSLVVLDAQTCSDKMMLASDGVDNICEMCWCWCISSWHVFPCLAPRTLCLHYKLGVKIRKAFPPFCPAHSIRCSCHGLCPDQASEFVWAEKEMDIMHIKGKPL